MKKNKRTQSLLSLALVLGIALFANILGNAFFTHVDLTEEKRFTLTKPTRELVRNLDDVVYVEVMLEGEFPAGFKRLQRSVKELLDEFRSLSGYVEYDFRDPNEGTTDQINARREQLAKEGIAPTALTIKDQEGREEKLIYPYAKVNYKGRVAVVDLLDEQAAGVTPEDKLNTSISRLEYNFANALHKLQAGGKEIVAFTMGQGELGELERKDFVRSLRAYYEVGTFNLDSANFIPQEVKVLIVAKPRVPFSEQDLFKVDQYIMNGGKVIWLVDHTNVELDSLRPGRTFPLQERNLNLGDMLFRYGVRVNADVVLDLQCSRIPQVTDPTGSMELFQWYYAPIAFPRTEHPLVRNLDGINFDFCSSIDTIGSKDAAQNRPYIKKTIVLTSSEHSRLQITMSGIGFEILRYPPNPAQFDKPHIPLAVLLEGEFTSFFEHRITEAFNDYLTQIKQQFKPQSAPTKMLVVSDGDIAKNFVSREGQTMPLGYNRYERYQFANKDFLLNAVEYLRDESGIIEARGKEVRLRLLDNTKAQAEETLWQVVNIVVPLVLLAIFGVVYTWLRRRRFAK